MNTYISTGAFKTKDIVEILEIAAGGGIRKIEISPGLSYCKDIKTILLSKREEFDFLVHNYFPTPKIPFALNLASNNQETIERSMKMCKEAIDFAYALGIPFYSVHCGYCFDTDGKALGNRGQIELPRILYEDAKSIFANNIKSLCEYAMQKGIKLAIENNVMASFAEGNKELYLGVDTSDLLELVDMIDMPNLGILLDLAHAQVSNTTLKFGVDDMISSLKDYILEIHISDNDGLLDENKPLSKGTTMYDYLSLIPDVPITIEVYDLAIDQIKRQIQLVDEAVGRNS